MKERKGVSSSTYFCSMCLYSQAQHFFTKFTTCCLIFLMLLLIISVLDSLSILCTLAGSFTVWLMFPLVFVSSRPVNLDTRSYNWRGQSLGLPAVVFTCITAAVHFSKSLPVLLSCIPAATIFYSLTWCQVFFPVMRK